MVARLYGPEPVNSDLAGTKHGCSPAQRRHGPGNTAWFNYLALPAIKLIKPENRWNKDETGLLKGQGNNGMVLKSKERANNKKLKKKQLGSRN